MGLPGVVGVGLNGSRVSSTITPAGGSATASAYCTDYAGRVTSITGANAASSTFNSHGDATSQGGQSFTYDSTDRTLSGTAVKNGVTQTFTYTLDATGRLITRAGSGSGTGVDTSTTTYSYTGDGDSADIQLATGNAIGERYISLPGGVLYTKRYTATGGDLWGLPNLHGDTVATTTSTGVMLGQCAVYDPYGTPLNPTTGLADTTQTPGTRTGGLTDAWEGTHQRGYEHTNGANWTLMGARTYLPVLGIFTSPDPVFGGNTTTYTYPNDPVNGSDLNGEYGYGFSYSLGHSDMSPQMIMALFQQNVSVYFPFSGCGPTLYVGKSCGLSSWVTFGYHNNVRVTAMDSTSFTFKSLPGHFEGANKWIRFSVARRHGKNNLDVTAGGLDNWWQGLPFGDRIARTFADSVWSSMARSFRNTKIRG